jgi:hypothetical protein
MNLIQSLLPRFIPQKPRLISETYCTCLRVAKSGAIGLLISNGFYDYIVYMQRMNTDKIMYKSKQFTYIRGFTNYFQLNIYLTLSFTQPSIL